MRTKRVALHRSTVCSRVAGGEERSRRVRLAGRPAKEREVKRSLPGGRRQRERGSHLDKTLLLFKLKGAWLKVAFLLQVKLDVTSG